MLSLMFVLKIDKVTNERHLLLYYKYTESKYLYQIYISNLHMFFGEYKTNHCIIKTYL